MRASELGRRQRTTAFHRVQRASTTSSVISDVRYAATLGVYAGLVDRILDQPERWLGVDPPDPAGGLFKRVLRGARRAAWGQAHPGSAGWDRQPVRLRLRWWLRRISVTAGTAAATPRLAGLLADRLPAQAALCASASGLAVCATARELGITDPEEWVPLLARVILGRDLARTGSAVPDSVTSEQTLVAAADDPREPPSALDRLGEGGGRAVRSLWRLARLLLEVQDVFDQRPRGGLLARTVARLPVVGIAGGWLDERGGIRAASRKTEALVSGRRTT